MPTSVLAIAAAVLMAVAQSFGWAGWLALAAPLPLVAALARGSFRECWLRLWLFYAVHAVLTLQWIRHTGPGAIWFLPLIIVYAVPFLAIPALCVSMAGRGRARLMALPAAWALAEILARRTLFQLNWTLLGQPVADYPPLAQAAAIAGPEAVSFLVLTFAVAAYLALRGGTRTALTAGGGGAVLIGAALLWGGFRLYYGSPETRMSVAVVQPVNSQRLLWTPANRKPVLDRMNRLIDEAAGLRPAMIVLPESAIQGLVRHDGELTQFIRDAVIRTRLPLLFGSADYEDGKFFNVAVLITPYNTVTTYRKIHLVPFVEYTPKGFPYSAPKDWPRYTPGVERTVFEVRKGPPFAVGICLEDTLPELAREYALGGAEALVALVNTENFLGTSESLQHLRRARLTAIASGLPIVQAANSGISASIDSSGHVLAQVAEGVPKTALLAVASPRGTLYRSIGDVGTAAEFLAAIAAAVALGRFLAGRVLRSL